MPLILSEIRIPDIKRTNMVEITRGVLTGINIRSISKSNRIDEIKAFFSYFLELNL
jgi:hypothetical protein